MKKGHQFKTTEGIATCVGTVAKYVVSIHLNSKCDVVDETYSGDIHVLLATKRSPRKLLGFLPLDVLAQCAVDDGLKTEDGSISLSSEECKIIDELSWAVLSEKYKIAPDHFVMKANEAIITFDPEGCKNFPNTAYVENFLGGVGRLCFPDGTVQFAENETYPDIVYSPRMTESNLEQFCKDNLAKYESYFNANFDAIDKGDKLPPIDTFWQ